MRRFVFFIVLCVVAVLPGFAEGPSLDLYAGAGYGFIVPETHSVIVEVDGYFFPFIGDDPVDALLAITLGMRLLIYEDGFGGAICAGVASLFRADESEWVHEIYLAAGISPRDEIQFYGEAGWKVHYHIFTAGLGVGMVESTVIIKASVGVTLRLL